MSTSLTPLLEAIAKKRRDQDARLRNPNDIWWKSLDHTGFSIPSAHSIGTSWGVAKSTGTPLRGITANAIIVDELMTGPSHV